MYVEKDVWKTTHWTVSDYIWGGLRGEERSGEYLLKYINNFKNKDY